jgi:oligoendopeptidase F
MVLEKVYLYAMLNFHLDMSAPHAQVLHGRAGILEQQFEQAASFIIPELARKDEAVLRVYMADQDFMEYRRFIDHIVKNKPHILSEEESALIALATTFLRSPYNIYSMFTNVDSRSNIIEDSGIVFIGSMYQDFNNTFAAILAAEVNKNIFWARAHNYNSALEASLSPGIPVSVYENLISSAHRGLASLHRFNRLLDEVNENLDENETEKLHEEVDHLYDLSYAEAMDIVLRALEPLGEDYSRILNTAFNNNWIDVFPAPNKRGGAYCSILFRPHPFILMNFNNTIDGASTLAHELGHAVHIYFSSIALHFNEFAPHSFTTEVAATLNDVLLYKYLIGKAATNTEKITYIAWLLHLYSDLFFYQTRLAEFQKQIHEWVEAGNTLNAETLNNKWLDLHRKYIEDDHEDDSVFQYSWAGIPHFYYNFYVYKYATSVAAASVLAPGILENKPGALDSYLKFLHYGSRYDPITLLKNLGLDMTSSQVFDDFIINFDSLVDEMERLIRLEGWIAHFP